MPNISFCLTPVGLIQYLLLTTIYIMILLIIKSQKGILKDHIFRKFSTNSHDVFACKGGYNDDFYFYFEFIGNRQIT